MFLQFPHFLHAPPHNSKDLEKSTDAVVAIPKPGKPLGDSKSYRPISLLYVQLKIFERLIYARVEPSSTHCCHKSWRAFDREGRPQTRSPCRHRASGIAFRPRRPELCRSTSQPPTTLSGIVSSPSSCCNSYLIDTWSTRSWKWLAIATLPLPPEMANGAGYCASRTASHRDLTWNSSSTSTCLTCLLTTASRNSAYADHLAIMQADGDWQAVEGVLSKDMLTAGEYLQTWKLKLSTRKTVSATFHLNNKEAKRELKVNYNNEILPFYREPKDLGVTLERSLMYCRHLESLRKKLKSRVALLRWLAGSGWGAGARADAASRRTRRLPRALGQRRRQKIQLCGSENDERSLGEGGVQSTLFCIFNHCYFISSPNKLNLSLNKATLYT